MSQEAEISVNERLKMMFIFIRDLCHKVDDPRAIDIQKFLIDDFDFLTTDNEKFCQKVGIEVHKEGEKLTRETFQQALEIVNNAESIEFTFSCDLQRLKDIPISNDSKKYILKRWEGKTNLIIQITLMIKDYVTMKDKDIRYIVDCREKIIMTTAAFDRDTLLGFEPTHRNRKPRPMKI